MTKYDSRSPYAKTPIDGQFLDHYVHRKVPGASKGDRVMEVSLRWHHRPDLMAYDLYGDARYWWVIPVRNGLEDLTFGVEYGKKLFVPPRDLVEKI